MPIFALFQGISAKSHLAEPFSTDWCAVDSLTWGVGRATVTTTKSGASAAGLGIANVERMQLNRSMDGASPQLLAKAIAGTLVGSIIVAIVDGVSNKTEVALKLEQVYVVSAHFSAADDAPYEALEVAFSKIALAVNTPSGMQFASWDATQNKPWADATAAFSVDTRWGIRVK